MCVAPLPWCTVAWLSKSGSSTALLVKVGRRSSACDDSSSACHPAVTRSHESSGPEVWLIERRYSGDGTVLTRVGIDLPHAQRLRHGGGDVVARACPAAPVPWTRPRRDRGVLLPRARGHPQTGWPRRRNGEALRGPRARSGALSTLRRGQLGSPVGRSATLTCPPTGGCSCSTDASTCVPAGWWALASCTSRGAPVRS